MAANKDTHCRNRAFERLNRKWANLFGWIAAAAVVCMLCLAMLDVVGGNIFRLRLSGSFDMIGLLGLIIAAFAMSRTQILNRNIYVDMLLTRLPKQAHNVLNVVADLLQILFAILLFWSSLKYAISLQASGEASMTMAIPFFPFAYAIVLSCIPLILILIMELIKAIKVTRSSR